ncbi:matrix metalloproteinase-2-like isoform X1 [Portunus trituberculatus]|uniref:matrix metalloproteinase-2-like isoform X1 n=1 Tax=Portunus trituberculatus TaxID=210409 RepID=UPI001E1CFD98|nr:matrix metalloproteinase-2-like isoform X1 [Portunus trituberculatus]
MEVGRVSERQKGSSAAVVFVYQSVCALVFVKGASGVFLLCRMAMSGWRWAAVALLWAGLASGVPLGQRVDYETLKLEEAATMDRAKREIDPQTRPKPRSGSFLHAMDFMKKFGYVENKGDNNTDFVYTQQTLRDALLRVQEFGGIEQTGELDEATVKLMETPRCGLPDLRPEDIAQQNNHTRRKRYIIGAEGWKKRKITYHVGNWSPQLRSKEVVQKELRRAFDAWSTYSHLQFTEEDSTDADIIIFFASHAHGDGYPFDYNGGILAHAFYPYEFGSYGGDVHFDESEKWIIANSKDDEGLDFFTVAVHELGHSLGLSHSPVDGSIMYPYYMGFNKNFALDYDDVMAMWELYIKRKLDGDDEYFNSTTTTTTTTTIRPDTTDHQSDAASDDEDDSDDTDSSHDENSEGTSKTKQRDNGNEDSEVSSTDDSDSDNDNDDDDDLFHYHGDYETVEDHQRRVNKEKNSKNKLPSLPSLPSDDSENEVWGGDDNKEEEDFYEKDKRKREEIERERAEERRRKEEEERRRREEEEEIRRREDEIRRREEEERRRWEAEEEEWQRTGGNGDNGQPVPSPPPPHPTTPAPSIPDLCEGNYDAMAVLRQEMFIFKASTYGGSGSGGGSCTATRPPSTHCSPPCPATSRR